MDLSIDNFLNELNEKFINSELDVNNLKYDVLKDGTYNFTYFNYQIGRIKIGKRVSKMQIVTESLPIWLENLTIEEYINNIDKWIEYAKRFNNTNNEIGENKVYCRNCGQQIDDKAIICVHCGVATSLMPMINTERNWRITLLLSIFLGMLGGHRFYTGYIGVGITQLLLTITGFGALFSLVWVVIDIINILSGNFRTKDGKDLIR